MPRPDLENTFRHFFDHIIAKGLESFGEGFRVKSRMARLGLCQKKDCLSIQLVGIRRFESIYDFSKIFVSRVSLGVDDEY